MDKPQLPKMLKKLHLLVFLVCSLIGLSGHAQTFPVTISTQITQPSPIYLSNYADATTINSPLKIQLVLNDLTISNRQVRIKCYFQGNSISFSTNDFVVGARPLYLEGGFPLQLTNVDLAPYFEFQNILGLNPNQYAQPLPEGIYNFSVEVYDFATNKKLSKKTSVTTIIFQNEPPFLNLPLNNASIMQSNIQNIIFSWTPRSINVSNVEYEFSLVEIWDNYTPVQNAFAYSPPLYTTTTRNTTFQYGISQPQLIPGKKYAWRIKAKAILGAEEIGVFKNNGYSEIFSFNYEVSCTAPLSITTTGVSEDQAKVSWSGNIDNYDYQVNYREKNAGSEWYKIVTPRESVTISNLKPNATYEYTVGASCDVGKYTHSTIHEFTTLAQDEIAFAGCGIKPDPNDLANKTPLPQLFANDVVTAGDFPIVVLKATGSNGNFTGEGYVTLPFLEKFRKLIDAADALGGEKIDIGKFSRIRITFNNIGVNTDFKLISGEIVASYDPDWKNIADGDKILTDILGSDGKPVEGKLEYEVKSATLNPDGSTTIVGADGQTSTIAKSVYDQVYTDSKGNTVNIPANGQGEPTISNPAAGGKAIAGNTNGVSNSGEVAQISSSDVIITFKDGPGKYAFDQKPDLGSEKLKATYEVIPIKGGSNYNVNYKAVSDLDGSDTIIAEASFKNGKTKDDVVFKTNSGAKVEAKWTSDTKAEITLTKTLNFAKESIISTVNGAKEKDPKDATKTIDGKSDVAGKVNIWQLPQKTVISVTLLSVNGVIIPTVGDAKDFLNEVYNKVGVKFDVTTQKVTIGKLPNEIECGDSDVFNVYTGGQNDIISQIESNADFVYNEKTYYVLYTGKSGQNGYAGFMPLGGQYAFVFDNSLKTAAHELGHGIFGLKHPFSSIEDSRKTDLLMDYGTGTVLSHNDWDIIHSGGWKFYGFQKSSSGAQIATDYNYLMPNHIPFRFQTGDGVLSNDIIYVDRENSGGYPNGTLYGFNINGKKYYFETKKTPQGFYESGATTPYPNSYSTKFATQKFRLIIQQSVNSCNYYLAARKSINLANPDLIILDGDKVSPISGCKEIKINESTDTNLDGEIICESDPYNQKSLITYNNDITTYGEKIVSNLNDRIKNNEINAVNNNLNNLETDLNNVKTGDNQFIAGVNLTGVKTNSNIFSPPNIEELNDKLAYLKVSTGIEMYINFEERPCSYTDTEGQNFADKIFKNSNLSKNSNAIFILATKNSSAKNNKNQWRTYFVFANSISSAVQTNALKLKINDDNSFKTFGKKIIEFYKSVPKKQLQYNFLIEEATAEDEEKATEYNYLIKKMLLKKIVTQSVTGNAIQHNYYLRKIVKNVSNDFLISDEKELKEQYVKKDGVILANKYSVDEKIGKWRYTKKKKDALYTGNGGNYESAGVDLHIFDCDFSGDTTCQDQAIDAGFLVASVAAVPFGSGAVLFVDGVAVGYYYSQGDLTTASMYLGGYIAGPILGEALTKIAVVSKNVARFTEIFYLNSRLSLQISKGLDEVAVKKLLDLEIKNSSTIIECLLPKATAEADFFIKATDNELIAGYVKKVAGSKNPELSIISYETGVNPLTGKIAAVTEEELENILNKLKVKAEKLQIILNSNSEKLGITLNDLMVAEGSSGNTLVNSTRTASSSANEAETFAKEVRVADKAGAYLNDKIVLSNIEKSPAVDGIIQKTGQGVQIKSCNAKNFIGNVNKSYTGAFDNEATTYWQHKNISVHIEVTDATKSDIIKSWSKLQSNAPINENIDTIQEIVVHCTDGSTSLNVPKKI
ncbi:hypothetical protein AR687_17665 [Flavobacteriaceae bacterium CRH]|nr:hypothetical protein AR687_17665 [Flavobacteriaceae bacterium CRH]